MKDVFKSIVIGVIMILIIAFSRKLFQRAREETKPPLPLESPDAIEAYEKKVTETAAILARTSAENIMKRWKDRFKKG